MDDDALDDPWQPRHQLFAPIAYGLYEVTDAPEDNWAKVGDKLVLGRCAWPKDVKSAARSCSIEAIGRCRQARCFASSLPRIRLRGQGYDFDVPLLAGEHVTEDTGTGFVHTAPGHGTEDFEIWMQIERAARAHRSIRQSPSPSMGTGFFTKDAPGFEGKRVIDDKGKFGDANLAVIEALIDANALIARARLKHDYPHSWRSKKPVIFRATPQWFIAMDKRFGRGGTLRARALKAIADTRWVPPQGENRITGMVETRPIGWSRASVPGACRSRSSCIRTQAR